MLAEELRLSFPVAKQEPLSVATLISHCVANRKHLRPCRRELARQ